MQAKKKEASICLSLKKNLNYLVYITIGNCYTNLFSFFYLKTFGIIYHL